MPNANDPKQLQAIPLVTPAELEERARRVANLELAAVRNGTPNQQERYVAGVLPEDEVAQLAREELFAAFAGFARYSTSAKLKPSDLLHWKLRGEPCPGARHRSVVFETTQATELSHADWERYRVFQAARDHAALHPWLDTPACVTLEPLTHWATCTLCEAEECRQTVRVTIAWAGRNLVREYLLQSDLSDTRSTP